MVRGKIVRKFPMVLGIDLAGTVIESSTDEFKPGDRILGTGQGLGEADWGSIALVTFTAAVGIIAIAGGFQGWLWKRCPVWERVLLIVAGFLLVYPKTLFDVVGFALVAVVIATQWLRKPELSTRTS